MSKQLKHFRNILFSLLKNPRNSPTNSFTDTQIHNNKFLDGKIDLEKIDKTEIKRRFKMGKRKFNIKKNKANRLACNRENDQFDSIEDDNEKNEIGHKNLPRIISGLSKKAKRKAKQRNLKLKPSALNDVVMDDIVTCKQSK